MRTMLARRRLGILLVSGLALAVMLAWGLQAYFIKLANATMSAESIFVYMMLTSLVFIPVALVLTDFSKPVNLGLSGPWLAASIQILNASTVRVQLKSCWGTGFLRLRGPKMEDAKRDSRSRSARALRMLL